MSDEIKQSTTCEVEYCLEEFYIRRDRGDKPTSQCKFCIGEATRSRQKIRREERKRDYKNGLISPEPEKWCILCDEVKPFEEFYLRYDAQDLLSHYCRKCHMADNSMRKRLKKNANA